MINCKLEIISNEKVGKSIYKMRLKPDQKIKSYGEFINLTLPGYYLKRPFSVSDYTDEYVEHTWVFAHQEDNSEQLSDIAAFIVYNTEVPEDIKTSLIEAISDEFSIDKSSITLEYMDYEELKKY